MDFSDFSFESVTQVFNRVKNAVMNYTEYEIKVRDATNNEPWGASSTLMNEIASATFQFHHFNEIMTTIYKRLEESSNSEWRKIYKALQLLEFLLKNGSDNVIDSVKTHSRDISVLESFHYIDEKGKDQGINVRLRSKEILELVNNNSKLQEERQKAKENKSKYTGVSSSGMTSSRISNFSGNNSFASNRNYDSNGGFEEFEKYKVQSEHKITRKVSPPPPVQEVNLLDFDETPNLKSSNIVKNNLITTVNDQNIQKIEINENNSSGGDDWGEFTAASETFKDFSPIQKPVEEEFGNFADFRNLQINSSVKKSDEKKNSFVNENKDPYSNLVNLDALGSFTVKNNGPSLADLAKKN